MEIILGILGFLIFFELVTVIVYGHGFNIISTNSIILNEAIKGADISDGTILHCNDCYITNTVSSILFPYYISYRNAHRRYLVLRGSAAHKRIKQEFKRLLY